jgi:septal ring factor EnvC (AmiA/AmiB activator)
MVEIPQMNEELLRRVIREELQTELASFRSDFGGELRVEIAAVRTELRTDMGELRTELRTEMGELRTEMGELRTEMRTEMGELRTEIEATRSDLRGEMKAMESRLAENGRMQFRQLADLYRATNEKIDHLGKHLGQGLDATRGAIEALRSSIERQDFRADQLGRRITALETKNQQDPRD